MGNSLLFSLISLPAFQVRVTDKDGSFAACGCNSVYVSLMGFPDASSGRLCDNRIKFFVSFCSQNERKCGKQFSARGRKKEMMMMRGGEECERMEHSDLESREGDVIPDGFS